MATFAFSCQSTLQASFPKLADLILDISMNDPPAGISPQVSHGSFDFLTLDLDFPISAKPHPVRR
jgi:hypothetical protein